MLDALNCALRAKQTEAASKLFTPAPTPEKAPALPAPARKWSDRDYPSTTAPRVEAKATPKRSMHFKLASRTGR